MLIIRYYFLLCLLMFSCSSMYGQSSTVYATVLSNKLFIVGAANPQTGLFVQSSNDTAWYHFGAGNIRAASVGVNTVSNGRVLYIASGNGLHKSTDRGDHWKITTDWKITEVLCVCVDQHDTNRVFISTPYGIYRTTDGATSWMQLNKGLKSDFVSHVIIDIDDPNILYCSTEDGVYKSTNSGESWERMKLSIGGVRVIVQNPKDKNVLIAGTEDNGIYMSTDHGVIWEKRESGIDHKTFYAVAFDPNNPEIIYAGGYVTGMYKTTDAGKNWKRMNNGIENLNIHSIAVDPANSHRVYAGSIGDGVCRSDDGGQSWKNIGLRGSQIWSLLIQPY